MVSCQEIGHRSKRSNEYTALLPISHKDTFVLHTAERNRQADVAHGFKGLLCPELTPAAAGTTVAALNHTQYPWEFLGLSCQTEDNEEVQEMEGKRH